MDVDKDTDLEKVFDFFGVNNESDSWAVLQSAAVGKIIVSREEYPRIEVYSHPRTKDILMVVLVKNAERELYSAIDVRGLERFLFVSVQIKDGEETEKIIQIVGKGMTVILQKKQIDFFTANNKTV